VEVGQLVAVAPAGSFVGESEVTKANVSGVETTGRLLDEAMLGWKGGSAGSACVLSASMFEVGMQVPDEKPKRVRVEATESELAEAAAKLEEKLKKEAKVKAKKDDKAAEKEAKVKAAKDAKIAAEKAELGEEEEVELVKASKGQLTKIKKEVAAKRKGGEEVDTDDELEKAGFMAQ
jgi:hypothetical protein